MIGRHKKLAQWLAAGLVTEDQARAIEAYEAQQKSGSFGRRLTGVAVFAILVGILSIIASNWHSIGGDIKITFHVLLNIGVGLAAWRADIRSRHHWREGLTLALFGLTLTLIALIGQVYQLAGSYAGALSLWILATLPFMALFARTGITAVPWLLAILVTIGIIIFEHLNDLPTEWRVFVWLPLVVLIPHILTALGATAKLQQVRPALAETALRYGLALSVLTVIASLAAWRFLNGSFHYSHRWYHGDIGLAALATLVTGGAVLLAWLAAHPKGRRSRVAELGALFVAVTLIIQTVPLMLPALNFVPVTALVFIGYFIFVGWLGQELEQQRIISFAITVIAIRIYVIYLELFGSLLTTGFGLISGGIVLLLMIHFARKLNRRLAGRGGAHA